MTIFPLLNIVTSSLKQVFLIVLPREDIIVSIHFVVRVVAIKNTDSNPVCNCLEFVTGQDGYRANIELDSYFSLAWLSTVTVEFRVRSYRHRADA